MMPAHHEPDGGHDDGALRWTDVPGEPATADLSGVTTIDHVREMLGAASIRNGLDRYGAVRLRGLPVRTVDDFRMVRDALITRPAEYREKATPRTRFAGGVYSSTDFPARQRIRLHNENSYTLQFPGILVFCCLRAPDDGGATPVADCREVLGRVPAHILGRMRNVGWGLVRNYSRYLSLDWRVAFGSDSPADVDRYCAANAIHAEWTSAGVLHTRQVRPAVIHHPRTGDQVWFNHAVFWSQWSLDREIRDALVHEFGVAGLPFNTCYGDGGELAEHDVAAIDEAYGSATRRAPWQVGDVLIVDNLLAAHGREPYRGDRNIVVAMGDPISLDECGPAVAPAAYLPVDQAAASG